MGKEIKSNEELVRENTDLKEENEELKRQLALLKRVAFGQKSEKTAIEVNPDQLSLFNEAEKEQSVSEREEEKSIAIKG